MTHQATGEPVEIMLVEDNPGDVYLTLEALRDSRIRNNVTVVRDGLDALERLTRQGPHADHPCPDLILLDLNLPRMDGRELPTAIRATPGICNIPVVILTSSAADRDIIRTYELRANCFVTKPVDLDQFMEVVRSIQDFWLTIVKLPS